VPEGEGMKKKVFIIFFVLYFNFLFSAGGAGNDFLRVNPHAKSAAMANAYCAIPGDVNSIYFNPAGITFVNKTVISFTHYASFSDTNYEYLCGVFDLNDRYDIGAALLYNSTACFKEFDEFGTYTGDVDNKDITATMSAGYKFFDWFRAGINLKFFYSKLYVYTKYGGAVDIGMLLKIANSPDTFGALVIQNIGKQTAYINVEDPLPYNIKAGIGTIIKIISKTSVKFTIDVNRLILKDEAPTLDAGAEFCIEKCVNLRAGIGFKHDVIKITMGFGLDTENINYSYAFLPYEFLGNSHVISVDFKFF